MDTLLSATDSVANVLQTGGEHKLLHDDELPFAPSDLDQPVDYSWAEQAFVWAQRWRLPLTVMFAALIASASFFAYETQRSDEPSSVESPEGDDGSSGALAAAVGGLGDDSRAEETDAERASTTTTIRRALTSTESTSAEATIATRPPATPTTSSARSSSSSTSAPTTTDATTGTTAATSTSAPTTSAPTTTTVASTTTTAAPRPARLGDRVSYDDGNGPGVSGIAVSLMADTDNDGVGDRVLSSTTTDANGNYGFDIDPGCYEVIFTVPSGREVVSGDRRKATCVESGGSDTGIDLVLARPVVAPPPSCNVQLGDNSFAGVEIQDDDRNWAPSYAFYGESGNFLLSTTSLGPPDDTTNPNDQTIEWTSEHYGYEESDVYSVAAEDAEGFRSAAVTCDRRNI